MALTNDRELEFFASAELIDLPVDDNAKIFKGAFVGRNRTTGYARSLTLGDEFLGVAYRQADNTISGHSAGGIDVRLFQSIDIVDSLPGVSVNDIGKDVYAIDESTLTVSPISTSRIGRIVAMSSTNFARIRCQPIAQFTGSYENEPVVQLVDSSQTLTLDHINRTLLMPNSTSRTLTLPPVALVRAGGRLRIVKTSSAASAITLDGSGSETIDGATTLSTVNARYDVAELLCTGSEWIVMNRDIS